MGELSWRNICICRATKDVRLTQCKVYAEIHAIVSRASTYIRRTIRKFKGLVA